MKIFFDTIGCRVNQAEIESLAAQFRRAGHEIVGSAALADLVIVNTCTVTNEAAADSRSAIRRAGRQGAARVVVTGCWSTLEREKALGLPGVESVIPNAEKDSLAETLLAFAPNSSGGLVPRTPLPGQHHRTRAFIKVQDGCDNACTYCVSRLARGSCRSRSVEQVLKEVEAALLGGTREIVLTGIALSSWGSDLAPRQLLRDLVNALLTLPHLPRLRLSSLEPWELEEADLEPWKDSRLCAHLHLPLQSGSRTVLSRMRRKITPERYEHLLQMVRRNIPGVAVTTDLISGFPGETEAEFNETLEFVAAMHFAGGHVFHFSPRPGTPAASMPGQVEGRVARERSRALRGLLAKAALAHHTHFIGSILPVLWEADATKQAKGFEVVGLTANAIRVKALADEPLCNQVDMVRLTRADEKGCWGEIIKKAPA